MSHAGDRRPVALLALALAAVAGCGDPDVLPTVPVHGTVTFKGKPLPKGKILFQPEKGQPATGAIEDGKFVLSTYRHGDGAVAGTHKVAVIATENVTGKDGVTNQKPLIPESYADYTSSGIVITVEPNGPSNLKIDLSG